DSCDTMSARSPVVGQAFQPDGPARQAGKPDLRFCPRETNRALVAWLFTASLAAPLWFLPPPAASSGQPAGVKLLLAFCTVRDRRAPPYPVVHFYEHDGVANGKLVGSIDTATTGKDNVRGDFHPSLSRDGRFCAFSGQMGIVNGGRIEVWDRKEKKL